ncbi:transcription elongation factor A N-terminal and central domain-containing protein [Rhinophrynus dorsalis]
MSDKAGIKELTSRALEVETLLSERRYEDITFHLNQFEAVDVTLEVLQQTDIVRAVYRVLKNCSQGALKRKAKALLYKWKMLYKKGLLDASDIQEECCICEDKDGTEDVAEHREQDTLFFGSANSVPPSNESLKLEPWNNDSSAKEYCCEQPKPVADYGGQTKVHFEDFSLRTKCTGLLCQALTESTECQEKARNFAKEIEANIYTMHSANEKKYRNCIRSKVSNLKNPKNSHLKEDIFSGALTPKAFAEMSVMEMASEELRKLRASYTEACVQEHQLPQGVDGVQTNKIKCRRCEKFDCTVTMISRGTLFLPGWVRSGNPDEEMMTFVICNGCGEKWYHSGWVCL